MNTAVFICLQCTSRCNTTVDYVKNIKHERKNKNTTQKLSRKTGCKIHNINPFAAPACKKLQPERCTYAPANSLFSGPITHLLPTLCLLMKLLSHSGVKKNTKRFKGFKLGTFIGRFQVTSWRWRGYSVGCFGITPFEDKDLSDRKVMNRNSQSAILFPFPAYTICSRGI